ncbi:MAG: antitoxin family protein [Magnetococcales bacterium]|nr:antitoxin family protein [Magnetococcales bacterium]
MWYRERWIGKQINQQSVLVGQAMLEAVEAVCINGIIKPLEPIIFEDAEHLVILRFPKTISPAQPAHTPQNVTVEWQQLVGVLKNSPNFKGDPAAIQRAMRHEWD